MHESPALGINLTLKFPAPWHLCDDANPVSIYHIVHISYRLIIKFYCHTNLWTGNYNFQRHIKVATHKELNLGLHTLQNTCIHNYSRICDIMLGFCRLDHVLWSCVPFHVYSIQVYGLQYTWLPYTWFALLIDVFVAFIF